MQNDNQGLLNDNDNKSKNLVLNNTDEDINEEGDNNPYGN